MSDNEQPTSSSNSCPDPNNPAEYCSTVPPLQQIRNSSQPPLSVLVPVGVLKRGNKPSCHAKKQVKFSDGFRPGDLPEPIPEEPEEETETQSTSKFPPRLKSPPVEKQSFFKKLRSNRVVISDVSGPLPPIINYNELSLGFQNKPSASTLIALLSDDERPPVTFMLTKNLHVYVKISTCK